MSSKGRFRMRSKSGPAVVFCVRCGSSKIDQPALDRLVCEDCHNSIAWDGLSFGLARCGGIVQALVRRTVLAAARRALIH